MKNFFITLIVSVIVTIVTFFGSSFVLDSTNIIELSNTSDEVLVEDDEVLIEDDESLVEDDDESLVEDDESLVEDDDEKPVNRK